VSNFQKNGSWSKFFGKDNGTAYLSLVISDFIYIRLQKSAIEKNNCIRYQRPRFRQPCSQSLHNVNEHGILGFADWKKTAFQFACYTQDVQNQTDEFNF